jgi:hypothetical protein
MEKLVYNSAQDGETAISLAFAGEDKCEIVAEFLAVRGRV